MDAFCRGMDLFRTGRYSDALQFLKTVYEIAPKSNIPLMFYLGVCYGKCGHSPKAETMLQAVVLQIPTPDTKAAVEYLIRQIPNYHDPNKIIETFEAAYSGRPPHRLLWKLPCI